MSSSNPNTLSTALPGAGTSFAVNGATEIFTGSVDTGCLAAGAVTAVKLGAGAVGTAAIGANAVGSGQLALNTIQHAQVALTAVQLKAMNVTPVPIIAAPGAGKRIVLHQSVMNFTAGTAFVNGGAVTLQYHTGPVAVTGAGPDLTGASSCSVLPAIAAAAVASNDAIEITNATAPFITGTGTMLVDVWYSVI